MTLGFSTLAATAIRRCLTRPHLLLDCVSAIIHLGKYAITHGHENSCTRVRQRTAILCDVQIRTRSEYHCDWAWGKYECMVKINWLMGQIATTHTCLHRTMACAGATLPAIREFIFVEPTMLAPHDVQEDGPSTKGDINIYGILTRSNTSEGLTTMQKALQGRHPLRLWDERVFEAHLVCVSRPCYS